MSGIVGAIPFNFSSALDTLFAVPILMMGMSLNNGKSSSASEAELEGVDSHLTSLGSCSSLTSAFKGVLLPLAAVSMGNFFSTMELELLGVKFIVGLMTGIACWPIARLKERHQATD